MDNNKYHITKKYIEEILESSENLEDLIQKVIISERFEFIKLNKEEFELLNKIRSILEIIIIQKLSEYNTPEFKALCSSYYDISFYLIKDEINNDKKDEHFIYNLIKFISISYLGEQWHRVKQFFIENEVQLDNIDGKWNIKILVSLSNCLISLAKIKTWKDVENVIIEINNLRKLQNEFENHYLNSLEESTRPFAAGELFSLYNLAKSIEILANYSINGSPQDASIKIEYHLRYSKEYAYKSGNKVLELLLIFFEVFSKKFIENTIWYITSGVNHWISEFNKALVRDDEKGVIQLLYPQRESIIEGQLFDLTKRAILVNLPTSSGKTLIAQYRILVALNQFKENGGWVAYIVPTRALINQVYRELKYYFSKISIRVEKLSGALELDAFETDLLEADSNQSKFDVLVTTYEKLNLIIRQGYGKKENRQLVLTVIDEAHNIGDEERGLTLELLLTILKSELPNSNFLLLSPEIPNSEEIVRWLAEDRGKTISLSLNWWQPNERIVGTILPKGRGKNYFYAFKTLNTIKGTLTIGEELSITDQNLNSKSLSKLTKRDITKEITEKVKDHEDTFIILVDSPSETFKLAEEIYQTLDNNNSFDNEIDLFVRYTKSELGENHPLVKYLSKSIAIHSSAIPDDIRWLIEDYIREQKIKILIATTTIAQGINFPIASVLVSSYYYKTKGRTFEMPARDFWNLAGRVGRVGQNKPGWVGIVCKNNKDLQKITSFVLNNIEYLKSQIVDVIEKSINFSDNDFNKLLYYDHRWSAILQYISHLYKESKDLNELRLHLEEKINASLGYKQLEENKKRYFYAKLSDYLQGLNSQFSQLSDSTGFSTITINQFIGKLSELNFTPKNWEKHQLFSEGNKTLQKLIGIMLDTYEIKKSLEELRGGESVDKNSIARLITGWVNGKNICELSQSFYPQEDQTKAIEQTTKAIYKIITNAVVWGMAAIQKMPNSGIDFEKLSDEDKKKFLNIPSYIYYGVNTDEAVLMRKHNVPRSIAQKLGELYKNEFGSLDESKVEDWLQKDENWENIRTEYLDGIEYKKLWNKLNL